MNENDVLIVGAGPSGLMMACQLKLQGIPFRIIEKRAKREMHSGALILQARSLELLKQMGLAEKFIAKGIIAKTIHVMVHGKKVSSLRIDAMGKGYSEFPFLLCIEQSLTEKLLLNFLELHGTSIEYDTSLSHFVNQNNHVNCTLNKNGALEALKSKYLVAADGAHSFVREQLKIPFIGKSYGLSLFVTDCKSDFAVPDNELFFSFSREAIVGFFPLKNKRWRIDGSFVYKANAQPEASFEKIASDFKLKTKINASIRDAEWFSNFTTHQKYAEQMNKGRSFLIGDAAHIHSPIGAQGMNTGFQDAHNLAWKMAFVLKGKADSKLLETYNEERSYVAKKVIKNTEIAFKLITSQNKINRLLQLLIVPLFSKILFYLIQKVKQIRIYLFKSISQTGVHYKNQSLSNRTKGISKSCRLRPGNLVPFLLFKETNENERFKNPIALNKMHLFVVSKQDIPDDLLTFLDANEGILTYEIVSEKSTHFGAFKKLGVKNDALILVRPDRYVAYFSNEIQSANLEIYLLEKGFCINS